MLSVGLFGQAVWQRGYPGTDVVEADVQATPDGGFIFTTGGQTVAIKTDGQGTPQWSFSLPDSLDASFGGSVLVLPDGNFVVVGGAYVQLPSFHNYDFAAKLDPAGNLLWLKFYLGSGGFYGQSVALAADGGLFIGNQYNSLMKTDADGNLLWQNSSYYVEELVATPDGGVIVLAYDYLGSNPDAHIYKVSSTGSLVWTKATQGPNGEGLVVRGMAATADGGFVVAGVSTPPNATFAYNDRFVLKYDGDGNQQWAQVYALPGTEIGENIDQTPDGGYVITGRSSGSMVPLWRLDPQGNQLWFKDYFGGEGLDVQALSDGFIMLTRGLRLVRTDAQGVVFQNKITGRLAADLNQDCQHQPNENGLQGWGVAADGPLSFYGTTDANGNFEVEVDTGDYQMSFWPPTHYHQPCQPGLTASLATSPSNLDLGTIPALSVDTAYVNISGPVFQDLDGDCEYDPSEPLLTNIHVGILNEGGSFQQYGFTDANGYYEFNVPAGDYYSVGIVTSTDNPYCTPCCNLTQISECNFAFLNGSVPITYNLGMTCNIPNPQGLNGFVFFDENENCLPDFGEEGLDTGWAIEVVKAGTQDSFLIEPLSLGSNGSFNAQVDTGSYYLTIIPPNYLYLPCQFVYTVNVGFGGAPTLYIPLMPLADCPKLTVDVGTAGLRPCFSTNYHVHYCNEGTAGADDAYVEVTFPPAITVDSSQIPGTPLPGNTWQFQLGDIPVDSCGNFWISTFLDCDEPVGLTYCVEAHIFPDSICGPSSPVWDGSSVELSADCVGDSVVLTISNAGWGNMSQPLNFIVVEDNVLIRDSTFQLPAGGSTSVTVFPNGATIILSSQQATGHPSNAMPLVFVEGCGADSISIGFVTQYPMPDQDCFLAIDCRESVAAFDPNIKEAQPEGITNAHFIENTTDLTYQITFQNLGTAAAENVVILDSLSQFLDSARLELGASSHPYTFEMLPQNVLKFTFPSIQLPSASQDYERSIGFVKFRVKQRPANLPGTEIHNKAGIYFDFNAPVITNTVTHRIPQPQYVEIDTVGLCGGEEWNDQPFYADTILIDTVHFAFFDSIVQTTIEVYPDLLLHADTTVAVGTVVYDVTVTSDTIFSYWLGACTFVLVNAHILTDLKPGKENLQYFGIAPNPASGQLTLSGQLSTGAFCEAKLMDAYGRTIVQLFENEWLAGSFSRRVDLGDVPAGLYFISFAMDGERRVLKLVVD